MVPPDSRASRPYDPDFATFQKLMIHEPENLSARFDALFGLSEGSAVNLEEFADYIRQGLIAVVYANHLSLSDKFAASLVTRIWPKPKAGGVIPSAGSLLCESPPKA